jgi:hypothetical protein
MKHLWGAGVQQTKGDFKKYDKLNYNATEVFIMQHMY